ncbi:MAG: hypothetical protein ACW99G_05065 [Candidatus Thorarchaeota archaeon]|jgi:hypothetical protein
MYKTLEIGDIVVLEVGDHFCTHCNQWVGVDPEMHDFCNRQVIVRRVYNVPVPRCGANQFGIEEDGGNYIWSECWIIQRQLGTEPAWEV